MPTYDPRIDAYIAKSAPFAQPVLEHIRTLIHNACPEVQETLKWSMPHFEYKGVMCGFAAFKQHCAFGFWKAAIMSDPTRAMRGKEETAMGSFGKISSLQDLPSDKILSALIREAMRLNEDGISVPKTPSAHKTPKPAIEEPAYVSAALKKNTVAKKIWGGFPPSHRREYLEWITEAKTEVTREKRLAQMIESVAEGRQRHWKYQK